MKTKQELICDIKKLAMENVAEPKLLEFGLKKGERISRIL